jgi:hypothetical protein
MTETRLADDLVAARLRFGPWQQSKMTVRAKDPGGRPPTLVYT